MKINVKGPIVDDMTGWVYDYFKMDAVYPKKLEKALEEANGEEITLEINSYGGMCVPAFDMYKMLRDYEGEITAHVTAAVSAATFFACAANKTLMSDAAIFMIHNSQSMAAGDYRDMEKEADSLKEFNTAIINVYQRKTGMNADELQAMMDNDTYMSPQKAIELGFADGWIYGKPESNTEPVVAVAAVGQIIPQDKAHELFMKLNQIEPETTEIDGDIVQNTDTINTENSETGGTDMNLEEFLAANPEAQAELNARIEAAKNEAAEVARAEGIANERERIKALDEIASGVTSEALTNAKYEDVCDAKELSYRAMLDEKQRMTQYMADAISDSIPADDVTAQPAEDENPDAEADELAAIVNEQRGGK